MNGSWLDRLGGAASAICTTHCLVMGLAPALVAVLGIEFLAGEVFEWGFFAVAMSLAVVAGIMGHRDHGTWWVSLAFAVGLAGLAAGRAAEVYGIEGAGWLAPIGGAVLVGSHVASAWRRRVCADC